VGGISGLQSQCSNVGDTIAPSNPGAEQAPSVCSVTDLEIRTFYGVFRPAESRTLPSSSEKNI